MSFTKTLSDVYAAFGSDVELECEISDHMADCEWYTNGSLVEDGVTRDRNKHKLQLFSISHDDEGEYECRCGNESTKATLGVKGICGRNIWLRHVHVFRANASTKMAALATYWVTHFSFLLFIRLMVFKNKKTFTKTYAPFWSDLINNVDHMRISGNEPSPVILSQTI